MPLNWIDVTNLSFNVLLLLERVQLSWLPGWAPENELAIALRGNPTVEWYLRNKCPELNDWLDKVVSTVNEKTDLTLEEIRRAEIAIMETLNDLVIYAVDPAAYDNLPFHNWDSKELLGLTNFTGKSVIDVGAGTGRLTFAVAPVAAHVFAVEPVTNLRQFIQAMAAERGLSNVYPVDGLTTQIPFPEQHVDISIGGHVFGGKPEEEYRELCRVTKPGGMIILCPGNVDKDNDLHNFLVSHGFEWSQYEEPKEGMKRKYWTTVK